MHRSCLIVKGPACSLRRAPLALIAMARITVEDCLNNVDNLFQLVLLAAQRARRLANGAEPTVPLENDKPTVGALREHAAGNVTVAVLSEPAPAPGTPAAIAADRRLDADTIVAAILHDVIEDTPTPKDQLATRFGAVVAELVDGVTKLDQIKFKSREEAQAESFRKMLLAMVRDLRVILVKLADRTHNMRTIEAMAPARRQAIARETLEIYAPIAE